jgi:ABC-type antimicrobial peptide transport system permease subunit
VAFAEAGILALGALALGAGLTAILVIFAEHLIADRTGLLIVPHVDFASAAYIVAGAIAIAFIAATFPAIRASRASIEELLQ